MTNTKASLEATHTFTIFTAFIFSENNDEVYGYLFNKTRLEAQKIVEKINEETGIYHYYMEGYFHD